MAHDSSGITTFTKWRAEGCPGWEELKAHPAASLFPLIQGQEFQDLVENIRTHGYDQSHPIVLIVEDDNLLVLDGRNRLNACRELHIQPPFIQWTRQGQPDASATEWVMTENLYRRHLTTSQRTGIAADLTELYEEEARQRQRAGKKIEDDLPANLPEGSKKGESRQKAAEQMKVSARSVQDAILVRTADPGLHAKVKAGKMTVNAAKKQAQTAAKKQTSAAPPTKKREQPPAKTEPREQPDSEPSPAAPEAQPRVDPRWQRAHDLLLDWAKAYGQFHERLDQDGIIDRPDVEHDCECHVTDAAHVFFLVDNTDDDDGQLERVEKDLSKWIEAANEWIEEQEARRDAAAAPPKATTPEQDQEPAPEQPAEKSQQESAA